MIFNENPYYNPSFCGLEIFDAISDDSVPYQFDMLIIWEKIDDGTLWWDTDAGCSCPVPFEPGRHDLKQITDKTFYQFDNELRSHNGTSDSDYSRITMEIKKRLKIKNQMA